MRRCAGRALAVVIGMGLGVAAGGGRPAAASTLLALGDDELVAGSDAVALVRVEEVHAVEAGGRISTVATVRVERAVKGTADGERLQVRTPGGVVGNVGQLVEGAPRLHPGDRSVVFLHRAGPAAYRFVGLEQGKLDVVPDPDFPGGVRVDRPLTARRLERAPDGTLREVAAPPAAEPLGQLLTRLDALAGGGR